MQIRRVVLKRVRNFRDFDRSFEDSWTGRVPEALLLMGPNGSGKSTLLKVVAQLWQGFNSFLQKEERPVTLPDNVFAPSPEFAAIELTGWLNKPVWVYAATGDRLHRSIITAQREAYRIGLLYKHAANGVPGSRFWLYEHAAPGQGEAISLSRGDPLPGWADRLTQDLILASSQEDIDLPNMVYLDSEGRQLLPLREKFSVQPEAEEYRWLARYEPATSRRGSLQNYLYNLKALKPSTFHDIVEHANAFLSGKRVADFDPRTGDLLVQIDGGDSHPIEELSSGEKQVLLMLATITRWLRPGGIVLIDEPDLHLHVSLATALVSHLRRLVSGKGGQLIVASHMPELWEGFPESHRVWLGATGDTERPR